MSKREITPGVVVDTLGMRAAGVDFGTVRIGVAVADELGLMAHPRRYVDGSDLKGGLSALKTLADEEEITHFVVGLPRNLNGREGPTARKARRFAELLGRHTGRTVELWDEWLTTREAQGRLRAQGLDERRSRERIDSAAAAVLLQAWLDARRPEER